MIELDPAAPPIGPLEYASPSLHGPKPWGKGFMAACATLVFWGLGQWIAGRRYRGCVWFIVWLVLRWTLVAAMAFPRLAPLIFAVWPLELLCFLVSVVDAFRCGRKSPRLMLPNAPLRYFLGVVLLAVGFGLALVFRLVITPIGEGYVMPTRSMMPTLNPNDRFLASKLVFEPKRWDVVVFHPPGDPVTVYVKRVAGLPGETLEIVNGLVRINGHPVQGPPGATPYGQIQGSGRLGIGCEGNPITLGPDEYFMLGDNSPISGDSRYWNTPEPGHQPGALPRSSIFGHVTLIYWPVSRARVVR